MRLMLCINFHLTRHVGACRWILAGLFAVLGTLDQVVNLTSDLPFNRTMTKAVLEIKVLLVLVVFVVAYFKFTWSLFGREEKVIK